MDLDAACLRWAKLAALERLARALRVPLPRMGFSVEQYHQQLVRLVARALDEDAKKVKEST